MPTLIGSPQWNTAGTGGLTVTLAVTVTGADQSIVVPVSQSDALTRTFTVSSSVDGAFTEAAYANPDRAVGAWILRDATVGAHTVTVTASATGVGFGAWAQVVEGLGTGTIVTDTQAATTAGDDHVSGATGLTTATAAFVVCVGALSGNVDSKAAGSGFTELAGPPTVNARFAQYRDAATPLAAEQGAWTSVGTNRTNRGVIVAFPEAGAGSTPSASGGSFITWFGR